MRVSISVDNEVVLDLLTDRRYDPNFGDYREGMRHKVFGIVHKEGETDVYLFLRYVGFDNESDDGLVAYLIHGDSQNDALEEATKIFVSITNGMDYHKHISTNILRPTTRWNPRLSGWEWDLLEEKGGVAGLSPEHWYEIFLSVNDTESLDRLAQFYSRPEDRIEHLARIVTDTRVLQYFSSHPDQLLSATPREFEQLVAELLATLGYKDIRLAPRGKDGGVDITAFVEHPIAVERLIVQCKRFSPPNKVGEPTIKQLLADVGLKGAARGLIVTTSTLTKPAHLLVESLRHRLSHMQGDELRRRLIEYRKVGPNQAL